jgi:histidinol dehydrogenase
MEAAAEFAGDYAPEHLEIHCENPEAIAKRVRAAGAMFLGEWTPEPVGDFTAGPSHVLPTGGTGKYFHGLTSADFMRRSSIVKYTEAAILREVSAMERIADMEGLDAHKRSASIRRTK